MFRTLHKIYYKQKKMPLIKRSMLTKGVGLQTSRISGRRNPDLVKFILSKTNSRFQSQTAEGLNHKPLIRPGQVMYEDTTPYVHDGQTHEPGSSMGTQITKSPDSESTLADGNVANPVSTDRTGRVEPGQFKSGRSVKRGRGETSNNSFTASKKQKTSGGGGGGGGGGMSMRERFAAAKSNKRN